MKTQRRGGRVRSPQERRKKTVWVFCSCCNKQWQISWLETTQTCFLTLLDIRSTKRELPGGNKNVSRATLLLEAPREEFISLPLSASRATHVSCLVVLHHFDLCKLLHRKGTLTGRWLVCQVQPLSYPGRGSPSSVWKSPDVRTSEAPGKYRGEQRLRWWGEGRVGIPGIPDLWLLIFVSSMRLPNPLSLSSPSPVRL